MGGCIGFVKKAIELYRVDQDEKRNKQDGDKQDGDKHNEGKQNEGKQNKDKQEDEKQKNPRKNKENRKNTRRGKSNEDKEQNNNEEKDGEEKDDNGDKDNKETNEKGPDNNEENKNECVGRCAVYDANYDGDTFYVVIGGERTHCRLAFVDCAEMKDKRPEYVEKATEAKKYTEHFLSSPGLKIYDISGFMVNTIAELEPLYEFNPKLKKSKRKMNDRYGRRLVLAYIGKRCLNAELIKNKLASFYDGTGQKFEI